MIRMRMLAGGFSILFWAAGVLPGWSHDFAAWDAMLKKYVRPTTLAGVRLNAVDYPSMAKDPRYSQVVSELEKVSASSLKTREEKLSFWINVYNVLAVKMVLDNFPLDSIKDAGGVFTSVWKKKAGVIGGREVTLHEIEHETLRKMGDPRIHAAIVCASVSCPDLRREAYTPQTLDRQLDDQLRRFLQNPGKGLRVEGGTLYLSSIFKWFAEDFESQGGVTVYLARFAPGLAKQRLTAKDLDLDYLDYNWDLNKT